MNYNLFCAQKYVMVELTYNMSSQPAAISVEARHLGLTRRRETKHFSGIV